VDTNTPVFLCTEPFFEGLLTVTEDCELTMEDFEDASALNFNFKAGAKDKCATAFKTAFQDIPLDMIGLLPRKYLIRQCCHIAGVDRKYFRSCAFGPINI
jgi:hypothetical protein